MAQERRSEATVTVSPSRYTWRNGRSSSKKEGGRFVSEGAVHPDASLQQVLVDGMANQTYNDEGKDMGTRVSYTDRELTDDELLAVWESTTRGVTDGTISTFDDKARFIDGVMRRLGR